MKLLGIILTIIILFIVLSGFIYLIGAFAAYDFNPANWSAEGRVMISILILACLAASIGITFEEYY